MKLAALAATAGCTITHARAQKQASYAVLGWLSPHMAHNCGVAVLACHNTSAVHRPLECPQTLLPHSDEAFALRTGK